ncbi:zinc/cadmium transporter, putative [Entamoeba histolytica HM-1:IMSS-B]|uniref:Zinc/cadmium transporter, putative n=6 Tax=Entamoeba histolytica TaxID=5759 RepID=C4LU69_ENTH1|nr:zinc/cadmium transporter, putative [Entamoeba histolytica HM-1:IMSS]EMD46396.1 zinc/cadmium transporter, putative [Entamoeba histolytica KU27]EMH75872.1 zinc/cadmium transporter, putative [Entamoeba histolytica HM-1:IMSS-B]EMS16603.1 zinc/cadmium transporter, putative [Entamoeba histolytica HM-3:IMSS]ENY62698.1 zinc/cadmium transporter, putative [Entamoeba histolytica HM-1:IMSS-A]GAT92141.1 zinc cadmium transporter putative [Entamoeba histolytica]|eukprot:XP_657025.1 zinc/cadmium transporter, putative [Entamoeba histolytica HM-1:IMSS]
MSSKRKTENITNDQLKEAVTPSIKPFEVIQNASKVIDHMSHITREQDILLKKEKWYKDINIYRLSFVMVMNFCYFLFELIIGLYLNSLILTVDSFNMLSDILSQIIGLTATIIMKQNFSSKFTYGFTRAEVTGAFINSVFQISIGLFMSIQSIESFFELEEVKDPLFLLAVSGGGLVVNIIGMIILHEYSCIKKVNKKINSSNKKEEEKSEKSEIELKQIKIQDEPQQEITQVEDPFSAIRTHGTKRMVVTPTLPNEKEITIEPQDVEENKNVSTKKKNINIKGVFIHVFGDALGSVATIFVALCVYLINGHWKYYLDPISSLIVSLVMMVSGMPLLYSCIRIVMQVVPKRFDLEKIRESILEHPDVVGVHDLHIWQLNNKIGVATLKVELNEKVASQGSVSDDIRKILNNNDIPLTTIECICPTPKRTPSSRECFF